MHRGYGHRSLMMNAPRAARGFAMRGRAWATHALELGKASRATEHVSSFAKIQLFSVASIGGHAQARTDWQRRNSRARCTDPHKGRLMNAQKRRVDRRSSKGEPPFALGGSASST